MIDNRTNEPTEAQIEAAAKAIADSLFSRWTLTSRVRASKDRGSLIHVAARAALVAAAGVVSQAPSEGDYILGLIETIKETGGAVEIHGVKIQPCDQFGNVEQPSSTVDEAALIREAKAEALEEASLAYGSGQLSGIFLGRDDYPKAWLRARAAEYREGSDR